jgi:Skp family chaperone for outer membrane proteins
MIKCTLVALLLIGAATLPAFAQGQGRIGTIDLRKVFDNYWKRQQAEAALKERGVAMDKELKGFMDDYNKTKEEYKKLMAASQDQSKSQDERDKAKSAAEAKLLEIKTSENTIRTYEENAKDQLDSQKKRMRDSLLQDIQTAINAKAKVSGYSLVIDVAADSFNQTPVVLYTNGENDMTDVILAQLNAGAPPPPADTTPKEGDTKKSDKK